MKIKETSVRVKDILTSEPETRDNDNLLLTRIWEEDIKVLTPYVNRTTEFLQLLSENKLTSFESCRRCRQLLQSCYPELRGFVYETRHNKAVSVKVELNEEKFPMILDSKYTRITEEIFKTLKKGDVVYYTHKDSLLVGIDINFANDVLILGTKYIVTRTTPVNIMINDMFYNPGQFSILELKK